MERRSRGILLVAGSILFGIGVSVLFIALGGTIPRKDGSVVTLNDGQKLDVSPQMVSSWRAKERRLESAEAELARTRAEMAALESRLRELEAAADAGSDTAPKPPAEADIKPDADAAAVPEDPEAEKQRKLNELLDKLDWDKMTDAIHDWIKLNRDARKNGKQPVFDPALLMELSKINVSIAQIAELLGEENIWAVWDNELVLQRFLPAYLKGMGAELTDAQRGTLFEWMKAERAAETYAPPAETAAGPASFDRLISSAERELRFAEWLRSNLSASQYSSYSSAMDNDIFYGQELSSKTFKAATEEDATAALTQYWQGAYGADPTQATALGQVADQYVKDYYATTYSYSRLYGNDLPLHVSFELQVKLLKLQATAEAQCRSLFPDADPQQAPTIFKFE
ncbi:MAG: hypothetical protein RDV41_00965 [Planctomycetota bacterium]|nr:hypothetical protein [Planctomycetota bacterium]